MEDRLDEMNKPLVAYIRTIKYLKQIVFPREEEYRRLCDRLFTEKRERDAEKSLHQAEELVSFLSGIASVAAKKK